MFLFSLSFTRHHSSVIITLVGCYFRMGNNHSTIQSYIMYVHKEVPLNNQINPGFFFSYKGSSFCDHVCVYLPVIFCLYVSYSILIYFEILTYRTATEFSLDF
jgi:hypothetical protein